MNSKKKEPARQYELSKVTNSSEDVIKDKQLSQGFKNPKVSGVTEHIDTKSKWANSSLANVAEKLAQHRALKQMGQKVLSAVPFAGAGYAAMSGDPAMAAEELAGDVPVFGQAYEAVKSDSAGQSPEDEALMLAEIQARKNYDKSPAHLARMRALQGYGQ